MEGLIGQIRGRFQNIITLSRFGTNTMTRVQTQVFTDFVVTVTPETVKLYANGMPTSAQPRNANNNPLTPHTIF